MNLLLFYAPISCAAVPFITLAEAEADFDIQRVDLSKNDDFTPEYLRSQSQAQGAGTGG